MCNTYLRVDIILGVARHKITIMENEIRNQEPKYKWNRKLYQKYRLKKATIAKLIGLRTYCMEEICG